MGWSVGTRHLPESVSLKDKLYFHLDISWRAEHRLWKKALSLIHELKVRNWDKFRSLFWIGLPFEFLKCYRVVGLVWCSNSVLWAAVSDPTCGCQSTQCTGGCQSWCWPSGGRHDRSRSSARSQAGTGSSAGCSPLSRCAPAVHWLSRCYWWRERRSCPDAIDRYNIFYHANVSLSANCHKCGLNWSITEL